MDDYARDVLALMGDAVDNIPGGQNLMTVGDDGGFEWQRARPNGTGGFHQTNYRVPNNTIARQG